MTSDKPDNYRCVELAMNTDTLSLRLVAAGQAVARHSLGLTDIRGLLRKRPLDAVTVEAMIAMVEDIVMPPLRELPAIDPLRVTGDELARVLGLLPSSGQGCSGASIEAVEMLFNQLADHAAGSPVAWRHATEPGSVALGLVVIREVMHHGDFHAVCLAAEVGMS